jgi:hypothetical protein
LLRNKTKGIGLLRTKTKGIGLLRNKTKGIGLLRTKPKGIGLLRTKPKGIVLLRNKPKGIVLLRTKTKGIVLLRNKTFLAKKEKAEERATTSCKMSDECVDFVSAFGEEVDTIMKNHLCRKKSRLNRLEAKQAAIKELMELLDKDEATYEGAIRSLEKKKINLHEIAKQTDGNKNEVEHQIEQISSYIGTNVPPHVGADCLKNYHEIESKILASQQVIDDMMTNYVDLLKTAQIQRAYYTDLLADCSLRSELDISHRVVGAKKAKKGGQICYCADNPNGGVVDGRT